MNLQIWKQMSVEKKWPHPKTNKYLKICIFLYWEQRKKWKQERIKNKNTKKISSLNDIENRQGGSSMNKNNSWKLWD